MHRSYSLDKQMNDSILTAPVCFVVFCNTLHNYQNQRANQKRLSTSKLPQAQEIRKLNSYSECSNTSTANTLSEQFQVPTDTKAIEIKTTSFSIYRRLTSTTVLDNWFQWTIFAFPACFTACGPNLTQATCSVQMSLISVYLPIQVCAAHPRTSQYVYNLI